MALYTYIYRLVLPCKLAVNGVGLGKGGECSDLDGQTRKAGNAGKACSYMTFSTLFGSKNLLLLSCKLNWAIGKVSGAVNPVCSRHKISSFSSIKKAIAHGRKLCICDHKAQSYLSKLFLCVGLSDSNENSRGKIYSPALGLGKKQSVNWIECLCPWRVRKVELWVVCRWVATSSIIIYSTLLD